MSSPPSLPDKHSEKIPHRHELRLSEIWKIIKYRRYFLALIFFLCITGTFLGHFIYTPTFSASATITVKDSITASCTNVHCTSMDGLGTNGASVPIV